MKTKATITIIALTSTILFTGCSFHASVAEKGDGGSWLATNGSILQNNPREEKRKVDSSNQKSENTNQDGYTEKVDQDIQVDKDDDTQERTKATRRKDTKSNTRGSKGWN